MLHGIWLPGFLGRVYRLARAATGTRPREWLAASYACVLLSIATKEVGITALPVFLLLDRAFQAPSWREMFRRRGWYHGAIVATVGCGAADFEPHPLGGIARRVPRTIEYVWYGHARLANLALDAGDTATARRLYDEITRLPALPHGGLDRPQIKALCEQFEAPH